MIVHVMQFRITFRNPDGFNFIFPLKKKKVVPIWYKLHYYTDQKPNFRLGVEVYWLEAEKK